MKKLLTILALWVTGLILSGCSWWSASAYWPTEAIDGYEQFSETALETALANGDNVVLFFWATRCPPCMKLHNDILENQASIPENITILTADFDAATELKEKYEVSKKHTAVYFWADGSVEKVNSAKEHSLQDILDEFANE